MTSQEGVIKFNLDHHPGELPAWADVRDLQTWFGRCRELDLIGQHPHRYQGAAYGNISQRASEGFLITGTQTGGHDNLDYQDISWVRELDLAGNRIRSSGPARPSSESMTHEQVYRRVPAAQFVIHVHSRPLWEQAERLGLAVTATDAEYGTPEMAGEVDRLLQDVSVREAGAFSMGGHEDGIVVFGDSAAQAGARLEKLLKRLEH